MVLFLIAVSGLQGSQVRDVGNALDTAVALRRGSDLSPVIIYSKQTIDDIKIDIDNKSSKIVESFNYYYDREKSEANQKLSTMIFYNYSSTKNRSMWRKELEEERNSWQKHALGSFDKKIEKGIVVYNSSTPSKLVMTEKDVADIADTMLNDDVSVVFSVQSADQANDLIALCLENGKPPIILNEPVSFWRAFFSDPWAVASVVYLTAYCAVISVWIYNKAAR